MLHGRFNKNKLIKQKYMKETSLIFIFKSQLGLSATVTRRWSGDFPLSSSYNCIFSFSVVL